MNDSECNREGIRKTTIHDGGYPARLKRIADPPGCLYLHGAGSLSPDRSIAIIGTRSPFYKATELSQLIARTAAGMGYVVVSGYATGVDTCAHLGAMDADAPTIAVLGSGILRKQPWKPSLERYILAHGLFVSELQDTGAERSYEHLMGRDRITSGLADVVIVVETDAKGGAVHTAELAARQGRAVYAVVWSGNKKYSPLADCVGTDAIVLAGIAEPLPVLDAETEFLKQLISVLDRAWCTRPKEAQ